MSWSNVRWFSECFLIQWHHPWLKMWITGKNPWCSVNLPLNSIETIQHIPNGECVFVIFWSWAYELLFVLLSLHLQVANSTYPIYLQAWMRPEVTCFSMWSWAIYDAGLYPRFWWYTSTFPYLKKHNCHLHDWTKVIPIIEKAKHLCHSTGFTLRQSNMVMGKSPIEFDDFLLTSPSI